MPLLANSPASALFKQAAQYLTTGNPAASALLPTLERYADYAPGWLLIGDALCRSGRRDAAAVALGRALQGRPISAALAHRIGQFFVELQDSAMAVMAFRKALSLDPDFAAGWYSLGLTLEDLRDYAEAAEAYHNALRLSPAFHEAAFNRGIVLQEAGRIDAAMDAYAEALRLKPDSFGRIAQALVSGRTGTLWLRPSDLRLALTRR
ncbi:tetratricopeptide repeat protein [Acidisoma sp.]|uniref:tetratricopeptide repeat protein n=1 Tax=Acidisoma sp. TaxID=1872115 RepID=UPI003B001E0F